MKTAVVLFCDDFRLKDSPALYFATQNYENILPVFIYSENYLGRKLGGAAKVFLHHVLKSFDELLHKKHGVKLIIKQGDVIELLKEIYQNHKFDAVYFSKSYTETQIAKEEKIANTFENLDVKSFKSKTIFDPTEISPASSSSNGDGYYKVFTPFSKECLKNLHLVGETLGEPEKIVSKHKIESLGVDDLNLLPKGEHKNGVSWHENLIENWSFNYEEIEGNFSNFLSNKMKHYKDDRNAPSTNCHTKLSPYLRFGMIGARVCFNAGLFHSGGVPNQFILELLWREFAYSVMFYNQTIAQRELKEKYSYFQWENDMELLKKWHEGRTGYDFVDAGMHELYKTGFMHGRTRMVVASFLTKDLIIGWRLGEEWFWDCLVDADPAVNPFSWQWVFGSGFDAAPYFRIFSPYSQKERFDPNGTYCKKWLPSNWKADKVVEHDFQRKITLERYALLG